MFRTLLYLVTIAIVAIVLAEAFSPLVSAGVFMLGLAAIYRTRIHKPPRPKTRHLRASHTAPGYVYLLRAGPYYKIGKSRQAGRRIRQIQLQLPFPVETVHKIQTADPCASETYWHQRFRHKRRNGEWFELSERDVADFRSYTHM